MTPEQLEVIARRHPWLADAPLFIDAQQVERFYDAVVRPPYVEGPTVSVRGQTGENTTTGEVSGELTLGAGGGFLSWLGLGKAEVKGGTKGATADKTATTDSRQVQWIPVRSPERQLIQLVLNYEMYAPQRLLTLDGASVAQMFDSKAVHPYPRALVILDLPGQAELAANPKLCPTLLIPMATELEKGGVALLFKKLEAAQTAEISDQIGKGGAKYLEEKLAAIRGWQSNRPPLPIAASAATQRAQASWEKLLSEFDPWTAMRVVEEAAVDHRIRWIDFRIPLTFDSRHETCHLHICPAGEYDTGVFAYNFIQRGFEFGVRIVGTLKAGSDLNVLAIYEK